jgi:hypothetical protein
MPSALFCSLIRSGGRASRTRARSSRTTSRMIPLTKAMIPLAAADGAAPQNAVDRFSGPGQYDCLPQGLDRFQGLRGGLCRLLARVVRRRLALRRAERARVAPGQSAVTLVRRAAAHAPDGERHSLGAGDPHGACFQFTPDLDGEQRLQPDPDLRLVVRVHVLRRHDQAVLPPAQRAPALLAGRAVGAAGAAVRNPGHKGKPSPRVRALPAAGRACGRRRRWTGRGAARPAR